MTRLASIKAAGSIVFCIATAIAASSQTSSNPGQPTTTVARIVKIVHLKNQTGSIGPITLYTPQEAGLFRVSLFMVATVGVGGFGSICPYLSFTDSVGPGVTLGTFCLGSDTKGNVLSNSVGLIESVAGVPITLSVQPDSHSAGSAYNVDVVVEALPDVSEGE